MTRHVNWLALASLAGATLLGGCADSNPSTTTTTASALVVKHLAARGADPATLRVVRDDYAPSTGRTHVRLEQEVDGLRVVGAYVKAAVDDQGNVVHVIDRLAPSPAGRLVPATGRESQALDATIAALGIEPVFTEQPSIEHVAYVDAAGTLRAGYLVETWTADRKLYETVVDAAGAVVRTELRTASDSYNVFAEDPGKTPQAVVQGPQGTEESPSGWLGTGAQSTIDISGNNVHAYLDAVSNNRPDRGGVAVTDGNFLTAANLSTSPSTETNRAVATQNLFYLNNVVHDILYAHGFTEAAGNFQNDNFGRGGSGNDAVNAEAQDGGGVDNANFSTPRDGRAPRMQMYLWSGAGPDHLVDVSAPASVAGTYGAKGAEFGPALTESGLGGEVVLVNDGTDTATDGCEAITNAVAGKIALIDRGTCAFTVKVKNAQVAGATAAIIANNQGGDEIFTMGGTDRQIKIPAVMVSQNSGTTLKSTTGIQAIERKNPNPPLQLDGDVDSDIVFHEYGHGLTWRMIGGMSGPLAGAIGEGASDGVSMLINLDDVVGEYSFSSPTGIRRFPYAGYPLTYGDVTGAEVHDDGEIYAAIIWRLHELFEEAGISNDVLLDYFVDGMNYTPSTPAYEDMRDGLLASAAAHGLGHECLIWQAFAQFGVGVGADGVATNSGVTITESFALPPSCP
jgi:hypothetical protein